MWTIFASGANVESWPGDAVVEARADRDEQVGLLHRGDRGVDAVHARHAEAELVRVRERAARHQCRDDREVPDRRELEQLLGGLGLDHAAADVEDGPLRLEDQLRGLDDLAHVALRRRLVAGQVDLIRPAPRGLVDEDVLRKVDEDRAGPAGAGDVERLADRRGDVAGIGHEEVVLRDRHRDAGDVGLLERVVADDRRGDLPGDRDDRDGVHLRVGERGHEVAAARAGRRDRDADLAGRPGVALGGVAGALLVPA